MGYRYYLSAQKPVCFPFGYGLSYTTFQYSDLSVSDKEVTFTLTNTGDRAGAEVAQLYVALPESKIFRAARELKGFAKVFLQPGESRQVTIPWTTRPSATSTSRPTAGRWRAVATSSWWPPAPRTCASPARWR